MGDPASAEVAVGIQGSELDKKRGVVVGRELVLVLVSERVGVGVGAVLLLESEVREADPVMVCEASEATNEETEAGGVLEDVPLKNNGLELEDSEGPVVVAVSLVDPDGVAPGCCSCLRPTPDSPSRLPLNIFPLSLWVSTIDRRA